MRDSKRLTIHWGPERKFASFTGETMSSMCLTNLLWTELSMDKHGHCTSNIREAILTYTGACGTSTHGNVWCVLNVATAIFCFVHDQAEGYYHWSLVSILCLQCVYINKYKNEVGCRDDTVPKTVDTRRHCEEE